jgi:hypothetical protein
MAAALAARGVFKGTAAEIADAIAPIVRAGGRSFITYDETEPCNKSKADRAEILKVKPLLAALGVIQPNLSFPKAKMVQALEAVAVAEHAVLKLPDLMKKSWAKTVAIRVRNACFHAARATSSGKNWASELAEATESPSDIMGEDVDEAAGPSVPIVRSAGHSDWKPEYSRTLALPFRTKTNSAGKEVANEMGLPLEIAADALDDDLMIGKFADGSQFTITELTVSAYRALLQRANKKWIEPIWMGDGEDEMGVGGTQL